MTDAIRILGAGPAGLTAAIALAKGGRQVEVFERRSQVGARFHDDYQGLENWSVEQDVLDELGEFGIEPDFTCRPFSEGRLYNPRLDYKDIRLARTLFYLVKRGAGPDTLDSALERQATRLGVKVFYNQTLPNHEADIVATGPRDPRAVAAGVTFNTNHDDFACVAVGDSVAPQGYAYLLVANGQGTLATVLFTQFRRASDCLDRTLDMFVHELHLETSNCQRWGGYGTFHTPMTAVKGKSLLVGEAAGFQDFLFGFGIRSAMLSGCLAARSVTTGESYDRLWRQRLQRLIRSSDVNRGLYARLGRIAYYGLWTVLGFGPRPDLVMRWLYNWRG